MLLHLIEIVGVVGVGLVLVLGGLVVAAVIFDRQMQVRQAERERRVEQLRIRRDRRIRELVQAGLIGEHTAAVGNGDAKIVVLRRVPPENGAA